MKNALTRWMLGIACLALLCGCAATAHKASYSHAPVSDAEASAIDALLNPASEATDDTGKNSEPQVTSVAGVPTDPQFAVKLRALSQKKAPESKPMEMRPERMLVWKANLTIQVGKVSKAVTEATALAERHGGFVEEKSDCGEEAATSASLTLRIPVKAFKSAVDGMASLGTVTRRNVEGEDVTEKYVDLESRLKNKLVLRDRLKQLLDKATEVKDILALEKELNRVQSDIDAMAAHMKSLKGKADYATVHLNLQRKSIKGPLGYFFSGLWWGVEKLFVIRE